MTFVVRKEVKDDGRERGLKLKNTSPYIHKSRYMPTSHVPLAIMNLRPK